MARKIWAYSCSTNTIWTSFDFGTVEAENQEEAKQKAEHELDNALTKANMALADNDDTHGFIISMDFSQIQITPLNPTN